MTAAARGVPVVLLDAIDRLGMQAVQTLARVRRYDVTALSLAPDSLLRFSRYCRVVTLPGFDWEGGPEQLDDVARARPGAVLLPVTLAATSWIGRHRSALGRSWRLPPGPGAEAVDVVSDKASFARFAEAHDVPTPAVRVPSQDGRVDLEGVAFPVLVKPRRGSAGAGIRQIDDPGELSAHLQTLMSPADYLVQPFLVAEDLSCGVLCRDGDVLAAVAYRCLARVREFGVFCSIQIEDDRQTHELVGRLMRALRWSGLANVDLLRTADGETTVLEVNPRMWGNLQGVSLSGVNFVDLLCRTALDEAASAPRGEPRRYFSPRDSFALWRDALIRGTGRCAWAESGFQFVWRDPIAYWLAYRRREGYGGPLQILRTFSQHPAPRTDG